MRFLSRAQAVVLGGICATSMAPVHAQEAGETAEELDVIVVTGSLLKRIDGEVALPVTVLEAEDLAKAGATNALEALQLVAQNQSTTTSNSFLGAGTGFASYASLRSLGSPRTLVLVNGKRIVNNPYQALGVDLNTIPTALIDRVEVLTDGASSTYGSDAIAGVVNYVTRRDVTGLTLSLSTSEPEHSGGGETYQATVGGGIGSLAEQGWSLYGGATWRKFEALANNSRDFAATAFRPDRGFNRLNPTTFPANYSQAATGLVSINPSFPDCAPPLSLAGGGVFGPSSCAYDFAPEIDAVPEMEQQSYIARGAVALGEHVASLEYLLGQSDLISRISPPVVQGLTMTSANPFYPGQGITPGVPGLDPTQPISLNYRVSATGLSTSNPENEVDRVLAQLEGSVLGWDYELSALRSTSTVKLNFVDGYVGVDRIRDGLAGANGAPFVNPFGDQTDAGQQYLLDSRLIGEAQRAKGELQSYAVQVSRELMSLPAGAVALALAAEYKTEDAEFRNNFDLIRQGRGTGLDLSQDASGDRHASSLAMETEIPLLADLDLGLAVRFDDYSDFGNTTNPKLSLRYRPAEMLLVRGSYNTGFRAATLYDLYAPNSLATAGSRQNDPVLCPGGVPDTAAGAVPTRDCNIQFSKQVGGNENLDAEESDAFSVGFVLQPTARLSLGADYWDYHVTQTISPLAEAAIFGDLTKYGDLIVRCSQVSAEERAAIPACNIPGGDPIAYFRNTTLNLGDTKTSGFDLTAQWATRATRFGTFSLVYRGTYVTKYDFQREQDGQFFDRNAAFVDGSPIIRYSHYATLGWDLGRWQARMTNRHKSGYRDCNDQCRIQPPFFNEVGSYTLWDLTGSYRAGNGLSVTAGVRNLFDRDPPFTNKNVGLGSGWDERYVDPLGRTFSLLLTYDFGADGGDTQ